MLPCVSISQVTVIPSPNIDTIRPNLLLRPEQVREVYFGLKQGEAYKQHYAKALTAIDSLNNIIQEQSYDFNLTLDLMKEQDAKIKEAYENMQTPWYKSPITGGILGLLIGILIAK